MLVSITCCARGRFFILAMFLLTCMYSLKANSRSILSRDIDQNYLPVNSTDKNSKAAVTGHAF